MSDLCDPHELGLPRSKYEAARAVILQYLQGEHDIRYAEVELYPNEGDGGVWWTWWVEGDQQTSYVHENGAIECYGVNAPQEVTP